MKKLVLVLLCMVLVFSMIGCDSEAKAKAKAESREKAEFECGKKTYDDLVAASELCEDISYAVYGAWYFSIYEYDDYDTLFRKNAAFSSRVGIWDLEEFLKTSKGIDDERDWVLYLDDFNYSVDLVIEYLTANGEIAQLNTLLANAKSELKSMTQKYSDYTYYPALKQFYAQVVSYAEFITKPTGSFRELKSTIENYENEIRTYKADLAFVFED